MFAGGLSGDAVENGTGERSERMEGRQDRSVMDFASQPSVDGGRYIGCENGNLFYWSYERETMASRPSLLVFVSPEDELGLMTDDLPINGS